MVSVACGVWTVWGDAGVSSVATPGAVAGGPRRGARRGARARAARGGGAGRRGPWGGWAARRVEARKRDMLIYNSFATHVHGYNRVACCADNGPRRQHESGAPKGCQRPHGSP